jgi:alkanesulfonate monooxygenase SsuD/methylene tetrahydromethanopterin reductase-like flavin-dependent oxidoreductase (luciferase family)
MEGYVRQGSTTHQRLFEIINEARFADECGLDSFGVSEQHFKHPTNSTSAPEVVLSAISQVTENIRIQPAVVVLPLHNPIQVAERWAAVDIVSGGRLDFGIGRGNTPVTADTFGVPIPETEARTLEGIEVVLSAWTQEDVEWQGAFYKVPKVRVTPRPLQSPHPPLFWAATSPDSHEVGGAHGFGLMTGGNALDLDQVHRRIERYREGRKNIVPIHRNQQTNGRIILNLLGHCAATSELAREQAERYIIEYVNRTVEMYKIMVQRSGRTVDFERSERFKDNFDELVRAGTLVLGSPEDCVEQLQRIAELGVDEVILRLDGPTHEELLECIRLLAKEVRPACIEHGG